MSEKAYILKKIHFDIQEVNFEQLKEHTNNIILEYSFNDPYFKRALFEMDRLNYNIGILITDVDQTEYTSSMLLDLLYNISGFNINLGVWINYKDNDKTYDVFNTLQTKFSTNFITGLVNCPLLENKEQNNFVIEFLDYPSWCTKGDIENYSIIMLDFIYYSINVVSLNTDYKTIYKENNLTPIKRNINNLIEILK